MDSQTVPNEAHETQPMQTPLPTAFKEAGFRYAPPGISPPPHLFASTRRFTRAHLIASLIGGMLLGFLLLLVGRWLWNSRPAAVVNGRKISRGQLAARVQILDSTKVLHDMVAERAIVQEAIRKGVSPSDAQVNEAIQESEAADPSLKVRILQHAVKEQDLRDEAVWKLSLQNVMTRGVHVTADDARRFYDTHPRAFDEPAQARARVILAQAADKAAEGRRMLTDGTRYSVISTTPGLKLAPGQRGDGIVTILHGHGRTAPDQVIDSQVFKLDAAHPVSDVFRAGVLYCAVELLGKTPERTLSFDEAKQRVIRYLKLSKGITQQAALADVERDIPIQYRGRFAYLKDQPLFAGLPTQGAK